MRRKRQDQPVAPVIFSDFDGTITQVDVTDAILNEFADPAWQDIEEEWVTGRIGSRECLRRQMALVRASAGEINALIATIPIDPYFARFYQFIREAGIPFYVVSDGFDYVIRQVLRRCGVDGELLNGCHLFSSSLRVEDRSLAVDFLHWPLPCDHGCATCKPEVMRRLSGGHRPVIFIGDGLSDRFAAQEAEVVFARDKLLTYCRDQSIPCQPFSTFEDIERAVELLVDRSSEGGKPVPAHRSGKATSRA
jgi:2,3-diketo-5-methylthio-1-phosphopentane phosphatase